MGASLPLPTSAAFPAVLPIAKVDNSLIFLPVQILPILQVPAQAPLLHETLLLTAWVRALGQGRHRLYSLRAEALAPVSPEPGTLEPRHA